MARKFYSLIVARATAFWYCKILSELCLYDMGRTAKHETVSRIDRIVSNGQKGMGAYNLRGGLRSWADWDFLREKAEIACSRRWLLVQQKKSCKTAQVERQ